MATQHKMLVFVMAILFGGFGLSNSVWADGEKPPAEETPAAASDSGNADAAAPDAAAPAADAAADPAAGEALLRRAQKLRAQQLVAEGDDAAKNRQYNRAVKLYEQAGGLDPENVEAQAGAERVRAILGRDTGTNLVEDYAQVIELRAQQAKSRYKKAMDHARESAKAGNFTEAQDAVSLSKAIIDTNRQYLTDAEYVTMNKAVLDYQAEIQQHAERQRLKELATQEQAVEKEQRDRRFKAEAERTAKVQEMLKRAADLRRELKYEQSLDVLDQVLFLDPHNVAAEAMKEIVEDAIIYRNTNTLERKISLMSARHSVQTLESAQPYNELIVYPPDWPQLSAQRTKFSGGGASDNEANRRIMEKLKQPIPVSFDANRLENVIEYLRNVTGVNFFVNWRALEGAGIEPGSTVTLNLANVPADKALKLILDQVGGDLVPLGYTVDDGVVTISTLENLGKNTVIHSYDIRDLLVQAPNFTEAPEFDLAAISSSGGGGGGGGGRSLFSESSSGNEGGGPEELALQIQTLIRDTVDPDNWRQNGGLVSSMSYLNGNLIINTTSANHRAILSLLGQLRESRAIQINVEARFLLVDQNYLDEVGVGVNVTLIDLFGLDHVSPIVITQEHLSIADRVNTGLTGSFGESQGDVAADGSFRRGMSISGSFLNDVQVDFLIRATQANRRQINLSAPRVTFFNGQRAYVLVSTQLAYVSDLDPVVGTRSAAFDPQISIVSSGVLLDVEGTVSADRRYVTLTARPSLARVVRLRGIGVIAPDVGVGDNGTGTDTGTGSGATPGDVIQANSGDTAAIPDVSRGVIEAPELELTTVRTTVSVPDKGTLLLGGQRLFADIEVEAGVPVLSRLPIVNRLFTNRSKVKDERTLLILVKPTILIQSEKEEELFPGLEQSPALFGGNAAAF
ncbi:MAG: hypothetical protein GC159_08425 [Phycisphaera sp.]|nr:hypothetical protein [Phycisphaera sp.]